MEEEINVFDLLSQSKEHVGDTKSWYVPTTNRWVQFSFLFDPSFQHDNSYRSSSVVGFENIFTEFFTHLCEHVSTPIHPPTYSKKKLFWDKVKETLPSKAFELYLEKSPSLMKDYTDITESTVKNDIEEEERLYNVLTNKDFTFMYQIEICKNGLLSLQLTSHEDSKKEITTKHQNKKRKISTTSKEVFDSETHNLLKRINMEQNESVHIDWKNTIPKSSIFLFEQIENYFTTTVMELQDNEDDEKKNNMYH